MFGHERERPTSFVTSFSLAMASILITYYNFNGFFYFFIFDLATDIMTRNEEYTYVLYLYACMSSNILMT